MLLLSDSKAHVRESTAHAFAGGRSEHPSLRRSCIAACSGGGGDGRDGNDDSSGVAAKIASAKADVRVLSLLSTSDPKLRLPTAELLLQLSRRLRRASTRAVSSGAAATGGVGARESAPDIAKVIIDPGGLRALWAVCSEPSPLTSPVDLEAPAVVTAAAMKRSTASSEAILALVSEARRGSSSGSTTTQR